MLQIIRFIPTRRSNGTIFQVVVEPSNLNTEGELYKAFIDGGVQYFKVLSCTSGAYRQIVGDMLTDKPLLIQNYGYYRALLGLERSVLAVGAILTLVTDDEEWKRVNTEARWL